MHLRPNIVMQAHATAATAGDGPAALFNVGGSRGSLKFDLSTSSLAVSVGGQVTAVPQRAAMARLRILPWGRTSLGCRWL